MWTTRRGFNFRFAAATATGLPDRAGIPLVLAPTTERHAGTYRLHQQHSYCHPNGGKTESS